VRELRNAMERAALLPQRIDLPEHFRATSRRGEPPAAANQPTSNASAKSNGRPFCGAPQTQFQSHGNGESAWHQRRALIINCNIREQGYEVDPV